MLVDRGLLYRDGDEWHFSPARSRCRNRCRASSRHGSTRSSRSRRAVLRDASVIGRGFWPAAVASVVRSRDARRSTTSFACSSARSSFVASARAPIAAELQYSFHHAVVRDVAYNSIPRAERAQKHWLAATWIESLGRPEDHAETIAHHYRVSARVRAGCAAAHG